MCQTHPVLVKIRKIAARTVRWRPRNIYIYFICFTTEIKSCSTKYIYIPFDLVKESLWTIKTNFEEEKLSFNDLWVHIQN